MKRYNFRLQKLLDIRVGKEEQCKMAFQKTQREKVEAEFKLNDLKDSYKRHNVIENESSTVERKMRQQYLNNLTISIKTATLDLEKKQNKVEIAREELKKSQVDRKTVEILKDKGFKSYLKEEEAREQRANDEFALYGFIRNLKGGEISDR